jgi:cytochrome c peroxidase
MSTLPNKIRGSAAFAIIASVAVGLLGTTLVSAAAAHGAHQGTRWTADERKLLASLSLTSLEPLAADPSNKFGDDARAAALGEALFSDTRLSGNGKVSCATCHVPSRDFQDGTPLGHGVGTTARRTMPIAGTAHNAWFFWDGRASSQWEQALGPLESAVEHGGTRTEYAHVIAEHYRGAYEATFGALPALATVPHRAGPAADEISRVYANIGKAIAAFERRIEPTRSRFDRYVDAELAGRVHDSATAFNADEEAGLHLFIGKANCANCHNGALLTDQHFHNTGAPQTSAAPDSGRTAGVRQALAGEFSCTSRYSDAKPNDCEELRFAVTEGAELTRAYKTPSLRNVANHAPYMHAGQFATLSEVLAHYNRAPTAPFGKSELKPLHLSPVELRQLSAFLGTLTTPAAVPTSFRD